MASDDPTDSTDQPLSHKKLLLITASGGALEFYDFTLFMLFAPFIRAAFFPDASATSGTLGVMGFFFAGYLARPLGGLIFSHLGDMYGRSQQFTLTLGLMSLSTLGIALLPTQAIIGDLSLVLLLTLRIMQGSLTGWRDSRFRYLYGGMVTMEPQRASHQRHHYGCHCRKSGRSANGLSAHPQPFYRANAGVGLAHALHFGLCSWGECFAHPASYGRKRQCFLHLTDQYQTRQIPLQTLLRKHHLSLFQGIAIAAVPAVIVSFYLYLPTWLTQHLQWNLSSSFSCSTFAFLTMCLQVPVYGWLSDRIGRKSLMLLGTTLLPLGLGISGLILSTYFADGLWGGHYTLQKLSLLILLTAIPASMVQACYETSLVELFSTDVRFTGLGLCHNLSFALCGGLSPLIMETLISRGVLMAPLYLVGGCAALTFLASCKLPPPQSHFEQAL